ncbi:MAG: two-component system response regulator RppA [Cyanobacteriota bacterium]
MKVLLVEDELVLGGAIKRTLNQEKYIVDWVLDGTQAWNCLENPKIPYTLAIFDWLLPGISGLELLRKLRTRNNNLPVLMLTAKDRLEDKVAGLDAGADDYLVKPFGMEELLARLRALQRRSPQFQSQQLQVGCFILDYGTCTVCLQHANGDKQVIPLTRKEFQVMEYFLKHPNQYITRTQLLDYLYELNAERISNVVAAQIRLVRRKLSELGCDGLIETVPGMGYRFNLNDAN